jgi:hypothetical protein
MTLTKNEVFTGNSRLSERTGVAAQEADTSIVAHLCWILTTTRMLQRRSAPTWIPAVTTTRCWRWILKRRCWRFLLFNTMAQSKRSVVLTRTRGHFAIHVPQHFFVEQIMTLVNAPLGFMSAERTPQLLALMAEHAGHFAVRRIGVNNIHHDNKSDRKDPGMDFFSGILAGFTRLRFRILHWWRGYHTHYGCPVRDVEHCDLCSKQPEPLRHNEGC